MKPRKPTLEDQLAFIAAQHDVYPSELFQALVHSRQRGESLDVAGLSVDYRGNVGNQSIFLIKKEGKVVAQFRVSQETLQRTDVSFENSMDSSRIRREIAKQNPAPTNFKIENLRPGMKKITVTGEVLATAEPSKVHTQFRDNAVVSNASIGDETGKILLCLWDQQINTVHVGDCIEIKNAHVALFKGERQLRLGKNGVITVLEKPLES